jgi:hypothetical protein
LIWDIRLDTCQTLMTMKTTGMTISGISVRATASAGIVEAAIIEQVGSWPDFDMSLREDVVTAS